MSIFKDFMRCRPGVLNLFQTADRSTLDNFTADHPGSAVELASGEGGGGGRGGGGRARCGRVCESLFYEMP